MPVVAIETDKRIIQKAANATCYVAAALREADFVAVPYLRCELLRDVCGPEISHAELYYDYGDILREDSSSISYYPPIDVVGKFIKISISDTVYADSSSVDPAELAEEAIDGSPETVSNLSIAWYGRIEHSAKDTDGTSLVLTSSSSSSSSSIAGHLRGTQFLTAYGLLRLLDTEIVDTSIVDIDGTPGSLYTVQAGLDFNSDPGGQFVRRGNRSSSKIGGSYVYNWQPRGGSIWTAYDAVEYLLSRQIPVNSTGTPANAWRIDDIDGDTASSSSSSSSSAGSPSNFLDWYDIDVKTDGRTVKDVIDELIPRHRGVGYFVDFDTTPVTGSSSSSSSISRDTIVLRVFTFASSNITLPNGKTFTANPDQRSLNFEAAIDIIDATVSDTVTSEYHKIIARGEKRTVTFTSPLFSSTATNHAIVKGWSSADESEYQGGAAAAPDYASLSLTQQQARNAIYRSSPRLEEVYRRFKLNCDVSSATRWNGKLSDPLGVVATNYWIRGDQSMLSYSAAVIAGPYVGDDYYPALRLHHALPLYQTFDYSGANLASFSYSAAFAANKHPSFIAPFVFAQTTPPPSASSSSSSSSSASSSSSSSSLKRYEMLDKLHRSWSAAGDRTWSASIAMLDTEPGFDINAGVPQYISGNSDAAFSAMSDHESPSKNGGIPYTSMMATICVELTEHAQQSISLSSPPPNAPEQVLILNVPNARHDYVLPYTVVDIKDGLPIQTTSGGFAKDDTLRLQSIARCGAQWYSQERQTLNLAFEQVRKLFQLGTLITTIGTNYGLTGINTPVTAITYCLGQSHSTRIETAYASFDFMDVEAKN